MNNALIRAHAAPAKLDEAEFDFSDFRVFTSVPDHNDFGIAALRGMVVIYDESSLHREGVIADAFYVRESQRPRSGMMWQSWLQQEWDDKRTRTGPAGSLEIRREVVQAIHWPKDDDWGVRLVSGHVDGPYYNWTFGSDFIGRVVGIYLPSASKKGC